MHLAVVELSLVDATILKDESATSVGFSLVIDCSTVNHLIAVDNSFMIPHIKKFIVGLINFLPRFRQNYLRSQVLYLLLRIQTSIKSIYGFLLGHNGGHHWDLSQSFVDLEVKLPIMDLGDLLRIFNLSVINYVSLFLQHLRN